MEIHWYQLLFQIINFTVLVFILNKFLYQPIITIINQRNKKIQDSIKAAEATLKEKATIDALKLKAIAEAEKEAVRILEKAKKQASQVSRKIITEAKDQAELEVQKKFQLLSAKLAEQEKAITDQVSRLVIKTTAKVLQDSLSPQEQKKIINAEIKKLHTLK